MTGLDLIKFGLRQECVVEGPQDLRHPFSLFNHSKGLAIQQPMAELIFGKVFCVIELLRGRATAQPYLEGFLLHSFIIQACKDIPDQGLRSDSR